jgi:O-antigen/teichoic acid export membrane protein
VNSVKSISDPHSLASQPGKNSRSNKKIVQGIAWTGAANWGCQLLGFAVYAGLARLLNPSTFGLVAIAGVYVAFIQVLVTQGFGVAIIQRSQIDREHLDSAFWIAVATAALFCGLSLLFAGQIARIFHEPGVSRVIAWLSLSILFYALSSVPTAILTRELDFRSLAIRSLLSTVVAGVVGLAMAFAGWGVWSLVGQQLVNAILGCFCLWWAVSWRPSFLVSRRHLQDLYGFSLSVAGNDVLWFFSQKSDQTLVGYRFGSVGLGPYSLSSRLVSLLHDGIISPLQLVAFPAFSQLQAEPLQFERALHKFCEMCSFVSFPVFAGIIAIAPDLVPWLFGSKWAAAIPILQILAVYGALRSALSFVHPLMLSKGRAGLYLLTNVILSCLTLAGCLVAARWNSRGIAISIIITMLIYTVVLLVIAQKLLQIKIGPLLRTFRFPALSSLFMLTVVDVLRRFSSAIFPPPATVLLCVLAGVVAYILTASYGKPELLKEIWHIGRTHFLPSKHSANVDSSPVPVQHVDTDATPESPPP